MEQRRTARLLGGVSIVAICAISPLSVLAQDTSDETYSLGTIYITGDTMTRSQQRTASSVTAVEDDEIEALKGADAVSDLLGAMANVTAPAEGGQDGTPAVRGQDGEGPNSGATAFFGGSAPRLAVNVDGHYLSYNELVYSTSSLWDVERVELFRGPQTVSQGANSIAGALVIETADPTFTREGAVMLEAGTGGKRRAGLMASGQVAPDVAARFTLDHTQRENFIEYTNPAFSIGDTDQDHYSTTGRFKLLWEPSQLQQLSTQFTYAYSDSNRPTWEAANGDFADYESTVGANPSWGQVTQTAIHDISYDFDEGVTLSNQLQFSAMETTRTTSPEAAGSAEIDQDNISNETRLVFGDETDTLSGVVGLFASHTKSDEMLNLRGISTFDDEKDSIGAFVGLDYRLTDRLYVGGSLRYQTDRVQRLGESPFTPNALDYDQTFEAWLPKLTVAYDVNEDTTIGAMIAHGYNPGGVTLGFSSQEWVEFDEETSVNFEVFGRTEVMDNRLGLTANLFYTKFDDMQRYVTSEAVDGYFEAVTVNAEAAHSYGLELGFDFEPSDVLRVKGNLGLLETETEEFTNASVDYSGNSFGNAPSSTFSLSADWQVVPDITLSGRIRHTGSYYSDDENTEAAKIDAYTVADTRVVFTPRDNVELYGYVNNVFGEDAVTSMRFSRTLAEYEATMVQPREIGLGVQVTF
ncbi:TonB-dependent receptor [Loktanella sp. S4079]|uniref:TonB-dependent receptor n=1 Tax=Loktanella sp. S4079 TaxID=579483 RepID=UPI0005F9C04A|nr:TonB-dependent receptor [Loktanella sp. S4079]KJZ18612.1 iron ABC transporter substrate-binding protein [Loktanella sp. S4079]